LAVGAEAAHRSIRQFARDLSGALDRICGTLEFELSRLNWFVAAMAILAGIVAVLINRTAHSNLRPFLGKWNGGFEIQDIRGVGASNVQKRAQELRGFVVLYGSHQKFDLEVSGQQQDIVVTGTWKVIKPTRVELTSSDVKIDDYGGVLKRDPNKPYIPNEDVTSAYEKPIILDLTDKGQKLNGLLISMGDMTGTHIFERVGSGR
jgi:hypothetical protein